MGENPNINRVKSYGPLMQVLKDSLSNKSPADLLKKFLIICPILPENPKNFTLWIDNIEALDAILDSIITNYNGDTSRLYITGSSRGGGGAWRFPKHSKHSVAAIVPVCGYFMDLTNLNALIEMPVWMTCNTGDYHYNNHKRAVSYIEEHGGSKVHQLK
jgi:predicted peptidase